MHIIDRILVKLTALREQNTRAGILDRTYLQSVTPDSLLFYYGNIHSQRGQDGILAEIFRRIGISKGTFVEFGAWDGMYLSNCRFLFEKGWDGVYIEADGKRYQDLCDAYAGTAGIVPVNALVGAPKFGLGDKTLAGLLIDHKVDLEKVVFVSIDVDGPDLEIFSDMGFAPPVILLEGGFNFSPYFAQRIAPEIAHENLQQPLPIIIEQALETGYTPVCFFQDTYLVRNDLAAPFAALPHDAVTLYRDAFGFMSNDYRNSLIELRQSSSQIKAMETAYFGHFSPDPMSYSSLDRTN